MKLLKLSVKKTDTCEILVFHNSAVEDSSLLGHNAMSLDKQFPVFKGTMILWNMRNRSPKTAS